MVWTINHTLNNRPLNVEVCDSNYNVIIPESTQYISADCVKIVFPYPQTGYAALTIGEGSSGTSGTAGTSGADGTNSPGGGNSRIQFHATSGFGGTTDFIIVTGSPTVATLTGTFNATTVNGTNINIGSPGKPAATTDDATALAIALG
jgi:hypothetical protein